MHNLPTWLAKYIASLSKENLHHAYLFYGREGLGKKDLLTYVSNTILCENTNLVSCGKCKNCKLILSNTHPDLHVILREEGKKNISISQIINLREKIYESAFLGTNKIISVPNIESMSRDASDAILKILEEPPKDTFFIMSSNFIHQIPSTIRSRSIEIEITVPSFNECHEWLSESYSENIDLGIELSDNRPLVAKYLMDLNILELRSTFIKDISGIIKSGKHIVNISEQWCKELETLPLKLEWMSYILIDAIKHESVNEHAEVLSDSENITRYLGENSDIFNLHELLNKTNEIWNLFSGDTNLRKEYLLQSLFVAWEKELGISSL
jgi:DNA polymerase-3 subunit delta'